MEIESAADYLSQRRGIFRENDVSHTKVSGDLVATPYLVGAFKTSTVHEFDRMTFSMLDSTGAPTVFSCNMGIFTEGEVHGYHNAQYNIYVWYGYARDLTPPYLWKVYYVESYPYGNFFKTYTAFVYKLVSITEFDLHYQFVSNVTSYKTRSVSTNLSVRPTLSTLISVCTGGGIVTELGPSTNTKSSYTIGGVTSPSVLRTKVEVLVAKMAWINNVTVPEKHYGDLAMEASEGFNAVNTNVIALLRDLRHPAKMIPKLKNLRRLRGLKKLKRIKSLSDDYLTVKYGILPTYDDLSCIFRAFRARGPYIDQNGFKTRSAGYTDTRIDGIYTNTLVQHLKLAISDEDGDLAALTNRVESMGILPTFEVVWDLVPYTFIIDWLVDVGGFLERVDTRLRLLRLNIRYVTMSRKTIIHGDFPRTAGGLFAGTIDWVHYHRWVSDQCPVPPLSLNTAFQASDHWLEASALLLQRLPAR
jgi:hypothetical protein